MKLSTREDVEAPLDFVFGVLTDFDIWERAALRRGADVQRTDTLAAPAPGMGWKVRFDFRGKERRVEVKLTALDRPSRIGFAGNGHAVEGSVTVDLVELGPKRTRVTVVSEAKPRTLAARIFMQSVKLAKAKLMKKYEKRVAGFAADIEDRYRRRQPL